ncbi:MAG: alpha/beta hydrolase [Bryobacteraceae bacterium]
MALKQSIASRWKPFLRAILLFKVNWRTLAGLSVLAALIAFIMSGRFADRFIFYPSRYPEGNWDSARREGAEDRWFAAQDGTKLNAWWFPLAGTRRVTLFLHGNAGNVTDRVGHAQRIREAGSAVLILDYRGYGKSKGRPTEKGVYQDAGAAYDELLREGFQANDIVIQGESLGTAIAVDLASRHPCAGLILESPMSSVQEIAATVVPWIGPIFVRGFNSRSKIGRVHVPLLIIHGNRDEIVPFSHGRKLFAAANEPKEFWEVPGGTHNELLDAAGAEYVPRLSEFYSRLMRR